MAEPRSPLAHRAEDLARIGATEAAFLAQIDLRADRSLAGSLPFPLPIDPNTFGATHQKDVLWLGPDEWLLVGPAGTEPDIVAELEAALARTHHSVVDVSASRAVLDLSGSDPLELLSKGCSLDLHPRSWKPGMCAQTLLARVQVVLQQRDDATRIFVRPSFADFLVDWLSGPAAP